MRLLNWEYGARLSWPDLERVEIQPMGRGTTQAYTLGMECKCWVAFCMTGLGLVVTLYGSLGRPCEVRPGS